MIINFLFLHRFYSQLMSRIIKIKRGKDIVLVGKASNDILSASPSATYAIKPTDFKGLIPKMVVKQGDEVKAGDCLFVDKQNPSICFTSPISGEIAEIVRGDRRAIKEVRILADSEIKYKSFNTANYQSKSSEEIRSILLESGLWPALVQRPFGLIAETDVLPKAIHISAFDSAPLAADYAISFNTEQKNLQAGVDVLTRLANCPIHINKHVKRNSSPFDGIKGVNFNQFDGPHPSGLVGVQIHHIDPINKGDVVWTLSAQHLVFIGRLFETGQLDLSMNVVVTGSEVSTPAYYTTRLGASVENILSNNLNSTNVRVISGNVLTGTAISTDGYIGYFHNQITVIPEGNEYEFLGWLLPSYARPTISNSLPISKYFKKEFKVNTNYHGEHRAFVVTGEYEKVLPMDILPVHLLKAILANDLDKMEKLGIYEIIEEDLALCEFVCTSKMNIQSILSEGIEVMASEG